MPDSPHTTHRERQKAATRRLLLDAAAELFDERGFDGTTMRDLATRAGVGVGTAFKHYPDKGSLVVAAFRDELGAAAEDLFASLPDEGIEAQVLHLVSGLYTFFAARPALSRVLVFEATKLQGESAEATLAQLADFIAELNRLVGEAVERGELRKDLDRSDVVTAFFSFYYAGLVEGLAVPEASVEARVGRVGRLLRQHMSGVAAALP